MIGLRTLFLSISLAVCSSSFAQTVPRTIEYEGNIITIESVGNDTISVLDPDTGEETIQVRSTTRFSLLNGNKIYQGAEAEEPKGRTSQVNLKGFLEQLLDDELKSARGSFDYLELVISEKGELAYYDTHFTKPQSIVDNTNTINASMFMKLQDIRFKPARKDGVAVPYYIKID